MHNEEEAIDILSDIYLQSSQAASAVALTCDKKIDRSGELLNKVRDAATKKRTAERDRYQIPWKRNKVSPPVKTGEYLVWRPQPGVIDKALWDGTKWCGRFDKITVTHWAHLPLPPLEEMGNG